MTKLRCPWCESIKTKEFIFEYKKENLKFPARKCLDCEKESGLIYHNLKICKMLTNEEIIHCKTEWDSWEGINLGFQKEVNQLVSNYLFNQNKIGGSNV